MFKSGSIFWVGEGYLHLKHLWKCTCSFLFISQYAPDCFYVVLLLFLYYILHCEGIFVSTLSLIYVLFYSVHLLFYYIYIYFVYSSSPSEFTQDVHFQGIAVCWIWTGFFCEIITNGYVNVMRSPALCIVASEHRKLI